VEFETPLQYHAVTVFEDDLICAANTVTSDYGEGSLMLMKMNKFTPSVDNARLIKAHLASTPTVLKVMHGGLQAGGQLTTLYFVLRLISVTAARCVAWPDK